MPKAVLSVEEIIATIRHSQLFTVIVEGPDDAVVFRKLEVDFADQELDLVVANGRSALFSIYERRGELSKKVVFIADRDLWIISGSIPKEYISEQLLFTTGYSIENDMFVDGNMIHVLTTQEREKFNVDLDRICKWFSLVVSRHLSDPPDTTGSFDMHPAQLLDNEMKYFECTALKPGESSPEELWRRITMDFALLLRGTTLLQLFLRCSRTHKYEYRGLLNFCAARRGPLLMEVQGKIRTYLDSLSSHSNESSRMPATPSQDA